MSAAWRWFLFCSGAGLVAGLVILVGEKKPLAGTLTFGELTIVPTRQ